MIVIGKAYRSGENNLYIQKVRNRDMIISHYITFFIFSRFLSNFVPCLTNILGTYENYIDPILYIMLGIGCVPCLKYVVSGCKLSIIMFIFLSTIVITINILLFPNNMPVFIKTIQSFCVLCVPFVVLINSIDNYEYLKKDLTRMAHCIGWILTIVVLTSPLGYFDSKYNGEYFGIGYSCMLPALLIVVNAVENKNKTSSILLIFTLFFLLMYGNRLPLFAIVLFTGYFIFRWIYMRKERTKLVAIVMLSILALLTLVLFLHDIAQYLYMFLLSKGIESRTLTLSMKGGSISRDPRVVILGIAIRAVKDKPFAVRGINADMVYLGVYPHNIFVEIIYQFGIFLGGILCIIVISYIFKTLKIGVNTGYGSICTVLMFASIMQLMVSLSLWNSPYFWAWLILIVRNKKLAKVEKTRGKYESYSILPTSIS